MGGCRSDDLRFRVVEAVAAGSARHAATERYSVSVNSAIRWSARAASEGTGDVTVKGNVLFDAALGSGQFFNTAASLNDTLQPGSPRQVFGTIRKRF